MFRRALVVLACTLALSSVCGADCPVPSDPGVHLVGCWDAQGKPLQSEEGTLPDNATCHVRCLGDSKGDNPSDLPFLRVTCWHGNWEGVKLPCEGTSVELADNTRALVRHKRFWDWIVAGIIALGYLIYRLVTMDKNPPQIHCPTVPVTPSDLGQTSASVTWKEPSSAYDAEEKKRVTVHRVSRKGPGYTFGEGTTEIWYKAKDGSGNEGRCKVDITVQVARCGGPVGVEHGHYVCYPSTPDPGSNADYVRGTRCHYGCYEGYRLHGRETRTCNAENEWSGPLPTCKTLECPALMGVPYAQFSCTKGLQFLSACSFSCVEGYEIPAGTSSVRVCGASGSWRGEQPQCKDSEPPRFVKCPDFQTLVADKGKDSCEASWKEPVVKDNSGEVISLELQGPLTQRQRAKAGIYSLVYSATDSQGNTARDCVVKLVIKVLTCPQQFAKPYQRVHCPTGNRYGSSCSFSCDTGFRQNGSDVSDCVISDTLPSYALWEWSHGTLPWCEAGDTCPRLPAPANGALACDAWEDGDFCKVMCQKGTDIPDSYGFTAVARLLVCYRNPTQGPHWNFQQALPDCTPVTTSHRLEMEARLSYYTGHCFQEEARQQIRDNFIAYMKTESKYEEPCKNNSQCSVGNVEVTCGRVRNRRSVQGEEDGEGLAGNHTETGTAAANETQASFQVIFTLQLQAMTSDSPDPEEAFVTSALASSLALTLLQAELTSALESLLPESANSSLPESELRLQSSPPQLLCPPGALPSYTSFSCVSCPKGSYFASSSKSCVPCPVGQYQSDPGQTECVSCPPHKTTLQPGSPSLVHCLDQCPPGQISADGIVPCSPCARGMYQPLHGQTNCLSCPLSSATMHEGSFSRSQCQDFDLVFPKDANASMYLEVPDTPVLVAPLTLALWFKVESEVKATLFNLSWGDLELLVELEDNGGLALSLDSAASMLLDNVTSGQWYHLLVEVGEGVTSAFLYSQGQSQNASSAFSFRESSASGSLSVSLGGEGFAGSVSQLDVWSGRGVPPPPSTSPPNTPPPSTPPPSTTPLCQQPRGGGGDVVSWRAWLQARDRGAVLQLPSLCDDTNECDSSPCVHGACADDFQDFWCTCDPGFTGKACDVNLDDCQAHLCNNKASCVDGVASYSCLCPPDFTGLFCDDVVTEGGWGTWSNWSECSVSCGKGEHSRVRRCDSPPPQNGGLPCPGNATESESCDQGPCPECVELAEPDHGRLECQEGRGLRRCRLLCEEGWDHDVEPLPQYTCGLQSGYVWNHQTPANPSAKLPSCLEIKPAEEVTTFYNATYRNLTCNSRALAAEATARITEALLHVIGSIECVHTQRCQVTDHVVVDCDAEEEIGERNTSTAGLSITVVTSPQTVGLQTSTEDLVAAVIHLNTSGHSGAFTVTVQGEPFQIDVTSAQFSGHVRCRTGWAKVNFYCVPCGPGTHWREGYCLPCHVGSFQGQQGQTACLPCPQGRSTPGQGSSSPLECSVELDMGAKEAMTLGAALGSVPVVISLVLAFVLYCRSRCSKRREVLRLDLEFNRQRSIQGQQTSEHFRYIDNSEKDEYPPH